MGAFDKMKDAADNIGDKAKDAAQDTADAVKDKFGSGDGDGKKSKGDRAREARAEQSANPTDRSKHDKPRS